MFKISDYVVYKNEVCIVKEIRHDEYMNKDFYILIPVSDNTLKIQIPTENKNGIIKSVMKKKDAIDFMDSISSIEPIKSTSKIVEADYKKLLSTNDKKDIVRLIKTTYIEVEKRRRFNKKEREIDVYYLDKSLSMLCNELAVSLSDDVDNIKELIISKISNEIKIN